MTSRDAESSSLADGLAAYDVDILLSSTSTQTSVLPLTLSPPPAGAVAEGHQLTAGPLLNKQQQQ
jgi:hypothetical protein